MCSLEYFYWYSCLQFGYSESSGFYVNYRSQIFFGIGALKNFAIFTEKHLCWSLFFKKMQVRNFIKNRLQHKCLAVNIAKFLKIALYSVTPLVLLKRIVIFNLEFISPFLPFHIYEGDSYILYENLAFSTRYISQISWFSNVSPDE